jgi:AmmeMemoRadiSam system protein A
MTDKQKQSLLQVVRKVIAAAVRGEPVSEFESEDPLFNEKRGCFVTIHNHGRLRGCIGRFEPDEKLIQVLREMAVSATRDPRFVINPVTPAELKEIDIEISVLSPLEKTDDPLSLDLGTHGIYIETGWTKEQFLSQCCAGKAGLPPDAWKQLDTEVLLFTAEVFGEKEFTEN